MGFGSAVAAGVATKALKKVVPTTAKALSSTSSTYGANKSATNRAMVMQSKGGQQAQQATSGNVGVVSQGMVNAEIQNDDVLDPTKLIGM